MREARERLVVALDFPLGRAAVEMVDRLRGEVGMFKIGKQLFTAEGPAVVREVLDRQEKVFLDLKFHDIPTTVAGAVEAAVGLGVSLVNVHASGGVGMMRAAAKAAQRSSTQVLGVTVLTSLSLADLALIGFLEPPERLAVRLARLALEAGLDGVVAAPTEVALLRAELGREFVIVTPGIRLPEDDAQDQVRIGTPRQTVEDGADFIVVGRPITQADDPAAMARHFVRMLE